MNNIKPLRLKEYDYKQDGYYFVTICTNYKKNILTGRTKDVVVQFIEQLPKTIKGVTLDYYIVMPTHVHMILVLQNSELKLGEAIRKLKAKASKEIGYNLWQPNYYEHIIRNEKALEKIREYIVYNPEKENIEFKHFYINQPNKLGNYSAQ